MSKAWALLVEDEAELALSLKLALKKIRFDVIHVATVKDAEREMNRAHQLELVIIDRMLPDGEGLKLCEKLREQGFTGAILILTARGSIDERVEGLKSGADDYLPKPFSWEELEARIQAVLRRSQILKKSQSLWDLKEDEHQILGPNGWAHLTRLEFQMASMLIRAAGRVISRDALLKEVWGYRFLPETRTVDFFIGRLRKKLENDYQNPKHFQTVRGAGYRFLP